MQIALLRFPLADHVLVSLLALAFHRAGQAAGITVTAARSFNGASGRSTLRSRRRAC